MEVIARSKSCRYFEGPKCWQNRLGSVRQRCLVAHWRQRSHWEYVVLLAIGTKKEMKKKENWTQAKRVVEMKKICDGETKIVKLTHLYS